MSMDPSPRRCSNRRRGDAAAPPKSLEVHIISAQRLPKVHYLRKTRAFAVAWVDTQQEAKQSTGIDHKGGRNPSWNAILTFAADADVLVSQLGSNAGLTVEIYARSWFGSSKLIGTVRVLLTDLLHAVRHSSSGKCFTFMIIRPSGGRKGLLNIGVPPERFHDDELVLYKQPVRG